jgi:PKD repeat protein
VADFTYSPSSPVVGQEVQFLDNSQGSPTSWSWDFGDGAKSTSKNPTHNYSKAGTFSVKLTVSDGVNSNTTTKSVSVTSSSNRVITAASPALADIQAAIAQANPGDTVVVPNGTADWTQALIITKGIILKAATAGGTTIKSGAASGSDYTDPANFLIAYVPASGALDQPFRLSGFVLDGNSNRFPFMARNTYLTPVKKFRLDHCEIKNSKPDGSGSLLFFYGEIYGVIDNNILRGGASFVTRDFALNETTWNNFTFDFGTENNRYYEDNIVYLGNYGSWNEGGAGGRYCVRYNTIYHLGSGLCTPWDMHGNQPGANLATMGVEVYENVIYVNNKSFRLFGQRGGKGLVYNNTAYNAGGDSYYGGTYIEEYYDYLNPPATNPAGQPQHISESYAWNNVVNGSVRYPVIQGTLDYGGDKGIVPRWDVHCFKEVPNFNGSSGVGVGPLSQRPISCTTEGVAWWATDENKLYRWHSGKWELYYVPYTYPHPLRTLLGD